MSITREQYEIQQKLKRATEIDIDNRKLARENADLDRECRMRQNVIDDLIPYVKEQRSLIKRLTATLKKRLGGDSHDIIIHLIKEYDSKTKDSKAIE